MSKSFNWMTSPAALAAVAMVAGISILRAADPGLVIPATSEPSDLKPGSMLIYNLYTSGSGQDTRISLTNTSGTSAAFVRLFFVDGTTGLTAGTSICLTAQQTSSFKASAVRPGVTGYLVALATDFLGKPLDFNFLTGQAEVKLSTGQTGTLRAIAHSKLTNTNVLSTDGTLAALFFDGLNLAGSYSRTGRVVQVPDIPSLSDGSTLVVLNRIGGNLGTGAASLGTLTGLLVNDFEDTTSFAVAGGVQLRVPVSNTFPASAPLFPTLVPAGHTGWMKFASQSDIGLSGSVLYMSTTTTTSQSGNGNGNGNGNGKSNTTTTTTPTGAINMRVLSLSAAANYTIPVLPPSCF